MSHGPLSLLDTHGQLFAKLADDGTVSDGGDKVIGRYDNRTHMMSFPTLATQSALDVRTSIAIRDNRTLDVQVGPMAGHRYIVGDKGALEVLSVSPDRVPNPGSSEVVGRLEGYDASSAGMFRLGVLLCALPLAVPPQVARPPLVLIDERGRLVAEITPEGTVSDHAGHELANFDAKTGKLTLDLGSNAAESDRIVDLASWAVIHAPDDIVIWANYSKYLIPPRRLRVSEDGELTAQALAYDSFPNVVVQPRATEEPSGKLKNYGSTRDDAIRLAALVYALPLADPVDPSSPLPVERPPPPPPHKRPPTK